MYNQSQKILHIPPQVWVKFKEAMLNARNYNEEVIGFLFCDSQQVNRGKIRYLPQSWIVPLPDCYEHQSVDGLIIKQQFHQYLLENQLGNKKLDVVHIHTHAGLDSPCFSTIDDRYESQYSQFLATHFQHQPHLISGVFNSTLEQGKFRIWNRKGDYCQSIDFSCSYFELSTSNINNQIHQFDSVDNFDEFNTVTNSNSTNDFNEFERVTNQDRVNNVNESNGFGNNNSINDFDRLINHNQFSQFKEFDRVSDNEVSNDVKQFDRFIDNNEIDEFDENEKDDFNLDDDLRFSRQKIFGDFVQKQLGELHVTLIGCGGIGSIFAETLGRLGVKKWTLIDPQRLEDVNLNRTIAATPTMVTENWYKVDYVKYLLERIYPQDSYIKTIPRSLETETIEAQVADTDLIVVATDNHYSRQLAQEIALKYVRPLISLGTHIDVKPDRTPRLYCRITIPPLAGDWCLMCGNIINLQQAALEVTPPAIHQLAQKAGYIKDVGDPAVLWLNSICASTAVGIIHGIIGGFVNIDDGLDWIYDFNTCNWLKTNPHSLSNDDCYFCGGKN